MVVLLRQPVVAAHGDRVVHVRDAVSARLTTADLVRLNARVELDGLAADQAAAEWLRVRPDAATTATPARP